MKCPVCETKISDFDRECPNCHIQLYDDSSVNKEVNNLSERESKNAEWLEIIANINLIIIILVTIYYFYEGFTKESANIIIGIGILISGLTIYLLLKTIVDIYYKIK